MQQKVLIPHLNLEGKMSDTHLPHKTRLMKLEHPNVYHRGSVLLFVMLCLSIILRVTSRGVHQKLSSDSYMLS